MNCAVIGGGAAGLMAACALTRAGARVRVLEKGQRVGKKLLATGNGRCNLTNMGAGARGYHGDAGLAARVVGAFPPREVLAVFRSMGVEPWIDPEGRVYPASDQASSVLDALRLTLSEAGGTEVTGFEAVEIMRARGGFLVRARDGRTEACDRLLLASGGMAAPALGGCGDGYALLRALGHPVTRCFPAIAPILTDVAPIRGLKGQRASCVATLLDGDTPVRAEAGEVLFTEYGLSGICVFQLARAAQTARDARISLDLAPDAAPELISRRADMLPRRALEDFLTGLLPRRVGACVLRAAGIADLARPAGSLSTAERSAVSSALRAFSLRVLGVRGYESAQVTAGGADMRAFDPVTLESRAVPGLFVAGEICDVDGDCGGFNLQWAWASALAAARGMRGA